MKAKKPLAIGVASFVAVVVAIVLLLLWYAPPLRLSSDFSVGYTVSGHTHTDAQLFRPVGISSRYYIFVPSPSASRYRWFVVDFSRNVAALPPIGVTLIGGSPCVHRDQVLGVLLTDAKTEDHWQVSVTPDDVQFSNADMSVHLTKHQ